MTNEAGSHWEPQPAGAAWIAAQLQEFRLQHPDVIPFELLLKERTGTRIVDWIDHLHVPSIAGIEAAGFVLEREYPAGEHHYGLAFRVL